MTLIGDEVDAGMAKMGSMDSIAVSKEDRDMTINGVNGVIFNGCEAGRGTGIGNITSEIIMGRLCGLGW